MNENQSEEKIRKWQERQEKIELINLLEADRNKAREQRANSREKRIKWAKSASGKVVISIIVIALVFATTSFFIYQQNLSNLKAAEEQAQTEKLAKVATEISELESKLKNCLNSNEYVVDFDAKGIRFETQDLNKIACASDAVLGESDFGQEFSDFIGRKNIYNESFRVEVGTGWLQAGGRSGKLNYKIILP